MADQTLDAKGLNCPLPILRTKKTISSMPKDSTLEVLATDPGSVADIASFCRTTGNELVESTKDGDVYRFLIKHTA
ncbi:MAG: sulfurtransferase TusA family protein [Alphaproteobacteria bacterium]